MHLYIFTAQMHPKGTIKFSSALPKIFVANNATKTKYRRSTSAMKTIANGLGKLDEVARDGPTWQ